MSKEEEFTIEEIFKDFPSDDHEMFKEDMVNKPPHYNIGGI